MTTSSEGSVLDRDEAGGFDRRFAADARSVTSARHALRDWLANAGDAVVRVTPDLLLIATELGSNAVRAGAASFRLRAWVERGGIAIEVADDGPGFDAPLPSTQSAPPLDAENGRGLFLVRMLVDRCTIFTAETGTIVRVRVNL